MTSDEAANAMDEVQRGGDRVIVVNSQPEIGREELPPRRLRSLGAVASHATDPMAGDTRPRRGGNRRGNPLLSMLLTAAPLILAAYGITFLSSRTAILVTTAILALFWLGGIVLAWRGLGPGGRDSRGGIWLGRAIGLVIGAVAAVSLLVDPVTPLL